MIPQTIMNESTVFELNSAAVAVLQEGRYEDAIAQLQQAMASLRTAMDRPSGFHLMPSTGYGSQSENEVLHDVSIVSIPVAEDQQQQQQQQQQAWDTNPFLMFDHAFVTVYTNYRGTRGLSLTCSFLLYNLGLCYHQREVAVAAGNNGRMMNAENLCTALKFYSRALHVIHNAAPNDGRQDDITVLTLAILNNLGHLYGHFGGADECQRCSRWIGNLLSGMQASGIGLTRSDVAFFYLNSIVADNIFDKAAAA